MLWYVQQFEQKSSIYDLVCDLVRGAGVDGARMALPSLADGEGERLSGHGELEKEG